MAFVGEEPWPQIECTFCFAEVGERCKVHRREAVTRGTVTVRRMLTALWRGEKSSCRTTNHRCPMFENEDDFDAPCHYGETVHSSEELVDVGHDVYRTKRYVLIYITLIGPQLFEVTKVMPEVNEKHRALGASFQLPKQVASYELTMVDGVPRWVSNGQVPPSDTIKELHIDKAPGFNLNSTLMAREKDIDTLRRRMKRAAAAAAKAGMEGGYSAEQMMEMRNNLGRGTTVVNVLTGRKTKL